MRAPGGPASSSAARLSSASRRVPDSTTTAPCACSARAMPAPMPPEAPVTRAGLPSNRNMAAPSEQFQQRLDLRRACRRRSTAASGAMRRIRPVSTLPAPSSTKLSTPIASIVWTHSRQRTVAVTCSDQQRADLRRVGDLGGGDVGDQRHHRRPGRGVAPALRPSRRRRAPSARSGTARRPAAAWRGGRPWSGRSRWRARPRRARRRSPPGRRRCRWPGSITSVRQACFRVSLARWARPRRRSPGRASFGADQRGHRALRRRAPPSASPGRAA